ncbi:N-acetyltransferase family 8 member 3-like [Athalia rosae]|uniref:N-acetyltransferase family 8 member 3-like n=1 Tax=Athalia rosae TaxID=37344 RepID=UPI002034752C|nr:N-acetyltransferase family 8 member 3-like [Athalia rosae]
MSHIIVIRSYKPSDNLECREIAKESVMSSINTAFVGNLVKEVTFELMILFAALLFIFCGIHFTICLLVVPVVVILTYISTYVSLTARSMEVAQEISNIPKFYLSNPFSGFWVAEAFEPNIMTSQPKDCYYSIMSENQLQESNIDVSLQSKRIIGTIGLTKSYRVGKSAWIKRLAVKHSYRRKGIGSCLLDTAVQFAINQGYGSVETIASEYTEGGREICLKKGFELKQMYHRHLIGSLITILMYELTYQIELPDTTTPPQISYIRSFKQR